VASINNEIASMSSAAHKVSRQLKKVKLSIPRQRVDELPSMHIARENACIALVKTKIRK